MDPVIGLNEMGIKDVVENDVTGILTNEDVKIYAKATIELLKNEENASNYLKMLKTQELLILSLRQVKSYSNFY